MTATSEALRDEGVKRVSGPYGDWIERVRVKAHEIAKAKGFVTADDLHEHFELPPDASPNLWGAVFRRIGLRPAGYVQTRRASGHARVIRRYSL